MNHRHAYRNGPVAGVIAGTVMSMSMMTIMTQMTAGHLIFGTVFAVAYNWYERGRSR